MNNISDFLSWMFDSEHLVLRDAETTAEKITLHIEIEKKPHVCPVCGMMTDYVHDYRPHTVKEVSILGKETILIFRKRRYRCTNCGKRFYENNDLVFPYKRMTKRLQNWIVNRLKNEYSYTSVAREIKTSVNTIIRIFDESVCYEAPEFERTIAIDEFKGNTGNEKYQCIITDPEKHRVLDILPNRRKATVQEHFTQQSTKSRKHIQYFIADMWNPYFEAAKETFENAHRIVDKYHWIRQVIHAFESIRKKVQATVKKNQRLCFKRSRVLLNKRYEYLDEKDKVKVEKMLSISTELRTAHTLKEAFFQLLESKNSHEAATVLNYWNSQAKHCGIASFEKCARVLKLWELEILHSFDCPYTNGFTEGCNNKIKVLKRNAYGYRNFERFRNRILHIFCEKAIVEPTD